MPLNFLYIYFCYIFGNNDSKEALSPPVYFRCFFDLQQLKKYLHGKMIMFEVVAASFGISFPNEMIIWPKLYDYMIK